MTADENVVVVSPSSIYRLRVMATLGWNCFSEGARQGFGQPTKSQRIDIAYLNLNPCFHGLGSQIQVAPLPKRVRIIIL